MQTNKRLLYTLFVTQSMLSASFIAMFTLLPIIAVRLSGQESLAGFPSTTQTFAQALLALPMALFMGRFGRRLGLSIGYAAAALGGLAGIFAIVQGEFVLLLLSAALLGLGRASGDQSRFAAGEIFPEAERARRIGLIIFAGTIGAIVGPGLVTPSSSLMAQLGLAADTGPWAAAMLMCTLAAIISFVLLRPDPLRVARSIAEDEAKAQPADAPVQALRTTAELLRLPLVQLGILAMLIGQVVMVLIMVLTPLHMNHQHYSTGSISLVISAHTLGMFGLSPLTGYLIDRLGRSTMLIAGAGTLIVSALMAPVASTELLLVVALFLLGLGWNFCFVSGSSLLASTLKGEERARVQGINDSLVFFAAGLGTLSAGPLFNLRGMVAVSAVGLALVLLLVAMIYRLTRAQAVQVSTA